MCNCLSLIDTAIFLSRPILIWECFTQSIFVFDRVVFCHSLLIQLFYEDHVCVDSSPHFFAIENNKSYNDKKGHIFTRFSLIYVYKHFIYNITASENKREFSREITLYFPTPKNLVNFEPFCPGGKI